MPIIALMLYDASRDRAHEAWEVQRDAYESAVDAAWQHEQLVNQGRQTLVLLAQQDAVKRGDAAACSTLLETVLQTSSRYTMLGVADLGGNVFCSALPLSGPLNVSDRSYFQRAYSTRDFVVGTYLVDRASGKATLPLAGPVTDASSAVKAVIFAGLDSAWLDEFARGSQLPPDADLSILDRDGITLAHYPESHAGDGHHDTAERAFRATAGDGGVRTARAKDEKGQDRYYAFVPLRGTSGEPVAFFGISFAEKEAFADINRRLRRNVSGLVVVALLALLAAWRVSHRLITRPTEKLADVAQRLASGDLAARSGLPHQGGEMGQLANSFDKMAGALQARQEAVERLAHQNELILDTAAEGIAGVDLQGNVTFINPAGARMLGWEARELIGKPAHETWHHSNSDGAPYPSESCPISRSLAEGAVLQGEDEVYWHKDGTSFPVEYTSTPIRDAQGAVTGAVVTFRDITERRQAEAELRQRYHELVALNQVSKVVAASLSLSVVAATAVEAALWVLNLDAGIIWYVDPATQELVALTNHGLPKGMEESLREVPRRPVSRGALAATVARTGEPMMVSDFLHDPRLVSDAMRTSGFMTYIGVPLKVQSEVVGVFSGFARAERTFTSEEVGLATSIGNVVGMAVANARLFDKVQAGEREWERTFNTMSEGVAILDPDFRIVRANQALAQMVGCSPEALAGERCYRVVHGLDSPVTGCPSVACVTEKRSCEMVRQEPYLGNRWLYLRSDPVLGPRGEVVSVVHAVQDITDLKLAERELVKLRKAVDTSGEVVFLTDREGTITFVNPAFTKVYGYDADEVVGKSTPRILKSGLVPPEGYAQFWKTLLAKQVVHGELVNRTKDGRLITIDGSANAIEDDAGNIIGFLAIQRDVTDRKLAEEQIRASLAEKEALLKEVHHRVKNNLQVISSLLDLQARSIEDEHALHLFRDTQNRVRSMALIHEQLYRSPDLSRIEFDEYVRTLTTNLFRTWGVSADVVSLKLNVEHVLVPVDRAVPFDLIINELVSNAFKHAFPGGRQGEVGIDFSLEDGTFSLVVRDNGVGIPPGFDIGSANSLGLQLVSALTRQCRGAMEVRSDGGTEFRLTFPA